MAMNRKLTYSREPKNLDLISENKTVQEVSDLSSTTPRETSSVLQGYEKTDGILSYNIVCVISGGERKEKDFLRELIRQKDLHSLRVAFISKKGQGLQPYQMQEIWLNIQQTGMITFPNQQYRLDSMDKVFLLSDVDEFYDQLVKIVGEHRDTDLGQWIISNPCFEIWLYYCFLDDPTSDLASIKPLSEAKRSKEMKRLGNDCIKGGLNPLLAFENMRIGINHSTAHYSEDEQSIPILFATQMHEMAQYLIDTMNQNINEYNEFIKKKREWRNMMKKD